MNKIFPLLLVMLLVCCGQGTGNASEVQTTSAASVTVVICYPGGSVQSQDAEAATASMLRVVEESGGWSPGSMTGHFIASSRECGKRLDEQKPPFAITTLGTFLTYREKLGLIPLAQPVIDGSSAERYRIMVRTGTYPSLEALKGKTIAGALVEEPQLLKRVVLRGSVDPESFFTLKGSPGVLRCLRKLAQGELEGVIVNSQQYRALASLPFAGELEVAFTSEEIPLAGIVANGKLTTADERSRFTRALSRVCSHQEGKKLCELFGVESFVPADLKAFQKVIDLWQSGDAKPSVGRP
jgi:ABC-type phosphate/phosphonate transport system substrate-binding protein